MGVSTDGQLSYGIVFPEGFEFPWDAADQSDDDWWREVNGYKEPFQLYSDDKQGYAPGIETVKDRWGREEAKDQKLVDSYYEHRRAWDAEHPFPIEIVNYCSGDCPMYILAVKESHKSNNRGYPQEINPAELTVTEEQKQTLIDFCNKYLKEQIDESAEEIVIEPKWYLSSYWG